MDGLLLTLARARFMVPMLCSCQERHWREMCRVGAVLHGIDNGVQPCRRSNRYCRGDEGRMNSMDSNYVALGEIPYTLFHADTKVVEHACVVTNLRNFWDKDADVTPVNITDGHIHQREIVGDMG